MFIKLLLISVLYLNYNVYGQLLRQETLGVYNPETRKYEKAHGSLLNVSSLGADKHDLKPHKKTILGGDDHDFKPHKKSILGGDDHDFKPHKKATLGGDDHDFKPHKKNKLGGDDHDFKPHKKAILGGDDHDYKPHKKPILGGDDHDLRPHKKMILGGDDHDYKPHRKTVLGGDDHDYKPHKKNVLGGDDHDYKPHKKALLGRDNHDFKPHKKALLGRDDHDFKPHKKNKLGGDDHDFKPHKKAILGGDYHDFKPHKKNFLGGDDHDFKPHKKSLFGKDGHDYKKHKKTFFGGDGHDMKKHRKHFLGGNDHDFKHHKKSFLGGGNHDYRQHRKFKSGGSNALKAHKKAHFGRGDHDYKAHKKSYLGRGSPDSKLHYKMPHLDSFQKFALTFNRSYHDDHAEFKRRFSIFKSNLKKMDLLQRNEMGSAVYGVNKFADWSAAEFSRLLGLKTDLKPSRSHTQLAKIPADDGDVPTEFDWRKKGVVTPVKNQGMCGSCWAFSVTGNVEGQWAIKHNVLYSLSEQELIDCDTTDEGCEGGMPENAYKAIEALGGLETEDGYPYEGKDDVCQLDTKKIKVDVNGSVELPEEEEDLKAWLYRNGPVSIGINANVLQFYMGGVSHPFRFLCNPDSLDHGMLIVGYGVHTTKYLHRRQPFWLVKNSWGKDWGEKGYYRVYRGDGTCGVNKMATSAVVA